MPWMPQHRANILLQAMPMHRAACAFRELLVHALRMQWRWYLLRGEESVYCQIVPKLLQLLMRETQVSVQPCYLLFVGV